MTEEKIDHPKHYNTGKIEVIDFIEDQKLGFHDGNVVKYVCRARHKGTELEDLRKAAWYLNRAIQNLEMQKMLPGWQMPGVWVDVNLQPIIHAPTADDRALCGACGPSTTLCEDPSQVTCITCKQKLALEKAPNNSTRPVVIHSFLNSNPNKTLCGSASGRPNVMNECATCEKCKLILEAEEDLREMKELEEHVPYELMERLIAALKEATK